MDRFKSPRIETDADLLKVMSYIDLNPKRAGITSHPADYFWSSYGYYAHGSQDPLITPAPSYLALGFTPEERQAVYKGLVEDILKADWKEKKPYSSIPFIGNPDWVQKRSETLQEQQKIRRQVWQLKKKLRYLELNNTG